MAGEKDQFPERKRSLPPSDHCRYCGMKLDLRYYFCVGCATPYQSPEAVVAPLRPPKLSEGESIRRKAPAAYTLFWSYFSVLVITALVSSLLTGENRPDVALVFSTIALLITTSIFSCWYWRTLLPQIKNLGFYQVEGYLALLLLVPLLGLNYLYHVLLPDFVGIPDFESVITRLRHMGFQEVTLIFFVCIFPAVTEEIAFRGLLQHWLHVAVKPRRAIILASSLFALVHFSVWSFPYLFLVGLLLGWAKWKTGSLGPSIVIHFLHNFAVLAFFPA